MNLMRSLLVQVCNLNPTFYRVDYVVNCTKHYCLNKFVGSGYKPEPARNPPESSRAKRLRDDGVFLPARGLNHYTRIGYSFSRFETALR